MRPVLTGAQMKVCDAETIQEMGMPSVVLMERAAMAVANAVREKLRDFSALPGKPTGLDADGGFRDPAHAVSQKDAQVLVICGSGNNGGDGFAAARILMLSGIGTIVYFAGREESLTAEAALQKKIYENFGGTYCEEFFPERYIILVDALFGVGLSRPVTGRYAKVIEQINQSGRFVIAVDLPSGVSADTGEALGTAVCADLTVTFAFAKRGQILFPGADLCGKVRVEDIGIALSRKLTQASLTENEERAGDQKEINFSKALNALAFTYDKEDLARLPGRPRRSNKGSFGKVLLIGGGENMAGAAKMAAEAAYRTGCGLVRVLAHEHSRVPLQTGLSEAIFTPWQQENALEAALPWATVVSIGPGLGTSLQARELLKKVLLLWDGPLIIDADGLNILSENPEYLSASKAKVLITPHPAEMSRLCKSSVSEIIRDLLGTAVSFALDHGLVCVLKDAHTVVSDGERLYLNTSGNCGMATGGSGDVLTGVIAGLLAQGMELFDAACLGVYVHGLAGDRAFQKLGSRGMLAGDLLRALPEVLK